MTLASSSSAGSPRPYASDGAIPASRNRSARRSCPGCGCPLRRLRFVDGDEMEWRAEKPGQIHGQRQRLLRGRRTIERHDESAQGRQLDRQRAAASAECRYRRVPGAAIGDAAIEQPPPTAGALRAHHDQIAVRGRVDNRFGGFASSDATLDR